MLQLLNGDKLKVCDPHATVSASVVIVQQRVHTPIFHLPNMSPPLVKTRYAIGLYRVPSPLLGAYSPLPLFPSIKFFPESGWQVLSFIFFPTIHTALI